jgi:hypothetical protein
VNSFYEIEQLVKDRQQEIRYELSNRPQRSNHLFTTMIQKIKAYFYPHPQKVQNQLCCMDHM